MILANPPAAGDLLISGSGLTTGIFAHSVIYLLDCDEDGALVPDDANDYSVTKRDLDASLIGAVERLVDFVTDPDS